ncbi:MAG: T9SS type A sorting domain-containing protein [Bacteroidota bacterium]|nr:T9SS type A sorting domain-containing protein [Bacteroidota bacterium]
MRKTILSIFLLLFIINSNATHIVGGSLGYKYVGTLNNGSKVRYLITVKLYRDCNLTSNATFDDDIYIGVYHNDSLNTIDTALLIRDHKLSNTDTFWKCTLLASCYAEGIYESYVDLDSGKEYAFFAGRCCVSQYKNIAYDQGMGFYAYMKNSSLCNSSPIMDRLPVNFVWIPKMPQSFSFRATDIDSDSLKYESIIPIAIGDKNSPKPRPELIIPSMVPPFDPSYIREVIYYPGYSLSAPFSSTTTLKLDSLSGQAVIDSGASVQNSKGKYLWCIKISEYKNNTLYGMTYTVINTEISPQCTTMAVPISEAALANIPTVSPNPFQNQIVINDLHGINSIEVYDLKGRLHQIVCTSSSKQTTILFNEAPSGLYLLRFVDAKGNIIASEKVVSE